MPPGKSLEVPDVFCLDLPVLSDCAAFDLIAEAYFVLIIPQCACFDNSAQADFSEFQ